MRPVEVTDLDCAFPTHVDHLMPSGVPDIFYRHNGTRWNALFNEWFFKGYDAKKLTPKPGIDKVKALRHIHCIMGSFEPKHEDKEAAVAYLLNEWFTTKENP